MRKYWLAASCMLAATIAAPPAQATDHRDGSSTTNSPEGDINDVFAWMSPDANTVHLVMTTVPNAGKSGQPSRFSNTIKYVFNVNSRPNDADPIFSGAAAARGRSNIQLIATFDDSTPQRIRFWVISTSTGRTLEYFTGDASSTAGLRSEDGRVRVFAGLRDDPTFFNQGGLNNALTYIGQVSGSLTPDNAGCTALNQTQQQEVASRLTTGGNSFAGFNALAIVVSIDKTLLNQTGPILAVWGSTHR
jgi:hypothetical protein